MLRIFENWVKYVVQLVERFLGLEEALEVSGTIQTGMGADFRSLGTWNVGLGRSQVQILGKIMNWRLGWDNCKDNFSKMKKRKKNSLPIP